MCELLSFFCCSSSSSSSSSSSCSSSFLSHVHFQFVTNFVGFALRLQRLKRPLGGHVLAFSLSLCRCTQTISVTYPVPIPALSLCSSLLAACLPCSPRFGHCLLLTFYIILPHGCLCPGQDSFAALPPSFHILSYVRISLSLSVCVPLACEEYVVAVSCLCNLLKTIQMTKSTLQAARLGSARLRVSGQL